MKRKLNASSIKSANKPGYHRVDTTLYLSIADGGSKSWIQRLTIRGKRRDIGLGGYPLVSIHEAREMAFGNRKLAREGGDPFAERAKARMPTFNEAARRVYAAHRPRWRSEKTAKNWQQGMARHVLPRLGERRVDEIGREDVLGILLPIWHKTPAVARRVRHWIRTVLSWCQAHGFIDYNMAGEMIDGALPAMPSVKAHYRALPYPEVPGALAAIKDSDSSLPVKLCFEFLVLTATRSGEARHATWSEIDLDGREWLIPAERMKAARAHRVPLSDPGLDVLEQAWPMRNRSNLVFPSPNMPRRPMADMTLGKALQAAGYGQRATVHGFRSSFRDWAGECTAAPHAVMELSLAHAVGGAVEQAYARSDLFAKRRALMEQWAAYLSDAPG